jgi:hypothetical protein
VKINIRYHRDKKKLTFRKYIRYPIAITWRSATYENRNKLIEVEKIWPNYNILITSSDGVKRRKNLDEFTAEFNNYTNHERRHLDQVE